MAATLISADVPSPGVNKVLLVDDEQAILELLDRMLTPLGYQCTKVASGEAAVDRLSWENFDIMLIDMIMPGMDGMALLRQARKDFPEMDVLVLTGFCKLYSYIDVIKEGAADFLGKPVDKDELKAKLYRITREQALRKSLQQEIEVRKLAEAELLHYELQLHDLIEERTLELKKANVNLLAEIEERRAAEKEVRNYAERVKLFAYSVSHDLKNPALSINGLADLLVRRCGPAMDGKFLETCRHISESARQLIKLVDNINIYIQSKENPLDFEEIAVSEVMAAVRFEFAEIMANRGVSLELPPALPVVKADVISLTRVFRNYIDNALKYGGDSLGRIEVSCASPADQHVFRVTNDGIVVGSEDAEKIFGLFNRSVASKGQKGTGLGLAIVREIAEQHQGRAWVESAGPGLTSFCFSLRKDL